MATNLKIRVFPYDQRWGGGYGWIILKPDGRTALDTSERSSATVERALAAAQRRLAREARV